MSTDLLCTVAEGLIGARAAGVLATESEAILVRHLETCESCSKLALELEAPMFSEAVAQASFEGDFDELAVVAPQNYVRGQEIGRGGMGQIVQAHDRRLGRAVAIKELIDTRLRARFESEARLTARLQHPAIVTVYEAGRWPSGDSFYAMKYVAGRPLDVVIAGMASLDERLGLLANLTTVVEAIAYAHSQRVVHRDLKPQNILIGPFGETVVIDWGLAKDLASAPEGATPFRADAGALTAAGAGTPAYMAPEQARGDVPDERVDVFALGATLHHVLAGDRPDLRPLPPETPRDLRAIVAKAMDPAKEGRYRTAAELAAELRRFQAGQLVAAHRYSLGERVRRFVRRQRTLVAVSAASVAILVATGVLAVRRILAERDQARAAQAEAVAHRRGAERLVDYMLHTLRPRLDKIGKVEILSGVGKEVADYFDSVPPAGERDPAVLLRRAGAFEALALADFGKGQIDDAFREGAARARLCEQAYALLPTPQAARCVAEARVRRGQTLATRGNSAEALGELAKARKQLDGALALYPRDVDLRLQLVELDRYRARASYWKGELAEAREAATEGAAVAERLLAEDPRSALFLRQAAVSQSDLGQMEAGDSHPERALVPYRRSVELGARARELAPGDVRVASSWAVNVAVAAGADDDAGAPGRARDELAPAIAVLREQLASDPDNLQARSRLAYALSKDCEARMDAGELQPARDPCAENRALRMEMFDKEPDYGGEAISVVVTTLAIARRALATGELTVARHELARANAAVAAWLQKSPGERIWPYYRDLTSCLRARLARVEKKPAAARLLALASLAGAVEAFASKDAVLNEELLVGAMIELARADADLGDDRAAEIGLRQLAARLELATTRWPGMVAWRQRLAVAEVLLAELRVRQGDRAEAAALRRRALALIEPLEERGTYDVDLPDVGARARRLPQATPPRPSP